MLMMTSLGVTVALQLALACLRRRLGIRVAIDGARKPLLGLMPLRMACPREAKASPSSKSKYETARTSIATTGKGRGEGHADGDERHIGNTCDGPHLLFHAWRDDEMAVIASR